MLALVVQLDTRHPLSLAAVPIWRRASVQDIAEDALRSWFSFYSRPNSVALTHHPTPTYLLVYSPPCGASNLVAPPDVITRVPALPCFFLLFFFLGLCFAAAFFVSFRFRCSLARPPQTPTHPSSLCFWCISDLFLLRFFRGIIASGNSSRFNGLVPWSPRRITSLSYT